MTTRAPSRIRLILAYSPAIPAMLGEPPPTQADLHFRIAGFPVRVHPFFWVISLLLGLNAFDGEPLGTLLAVAVVFVSILIHELGHAVFQRKFGGNPRIVLHGFGGLAICDNCDRSPRSQIIISLAGPFAGFLFAAATIAVLAIASGYIHFAPAWSNYAWAEALDPEFADRLLGIPLLVGRLWFQPFASPAVYNVFNMLLWINIFWGLMNLLPVYPLDGGRVSRELLTLGGDPQQGVIKSLQISIGVAAVVAVWSLISIGFLAAIMFGFLAYNNYQTLQAYSGRGPGYGW